MSEQLPAPLVSEEVDLHNFPGFILDVNRLLSSELVAVGSPDECWAAVRLWCQSWKQSPPASLPDDDKILAAFSGAGRRWPKIKAVALRGFVKCSDGRLYHKVLANEANDSWARRQKFKARGAKGNKKRWSKPVLEGPIGNSLSDPSRIAQAKAQRIDKESLHDPYSSQEKRREVKETTYSSAQVTLNSSGNSSGEGARASQEIKNPQVTPTTLLAVELRKLGVQVTTAHPCLGEWLAKATHEQIVQAVAVARSRKGDAFIPALYLSPIINDIVGGKHETHRGGNSSTGAAIMASGFAQLNAGG